MDRYSNIECIAAEQISIVGTSVHGNDVDVISVHGNDVDVTSVHGNDVDVTSVHGNDVDVTFRDYWATEEWRR
jgi:hypothetical protein